MKIFNKLMLFASLMILGLAMNGQNSSYIPLINHNNTWSIVADGSAGGLQVYSYYLKTDTTIVVINGKDYHKLMQTYDTLGIEDAWTLAGYISEDTISKQCYFISPEMEEGLIYDFSANVGDTLHLWNSLHSNPPGDVVIEEKDSVIIGGHYRTRLIVLWLNPWFDKRWEETWIEGIGSLEGLTFSNYTLLGINYALLCFYENDELVFINDFYDECYYPHLTGVQKIILPCHFNCFPNPALANNPVRISGLPATADAPSTIEVFDLTGRRLISAATKQTDFIMNAPEKPGVYFVIVSNSMFKKTLKMVVR